MVITFRVAGGDLLLIIIRSGGRGTGGGATLPLYCVWDITALQIPTARMYICYCTYTPLFEHLLSYLLVYISEIDMVAIYFNLIQFHIALIIYYIYKHVQRVVWL